jgi:hypothetical protein
MAGLWLDGRGRRVFVRALGASAICFRDQRVTNRESEVVEQICVS